MLQSFFRLSMLLIFRLIPLLDLLDDLADLVACLEMIGLARPVLNEGRHRLAHMRVQAPDLYHFHTLWCRFSCQQLREFIHKILEFRDQWFFFLCHCYSLPFQNVMDDYFIHCTKNSSQGKVGVGNAWASEHEHDKVNAKER